MKQLAFVDDSGDPGINKKSCSSNLVMAGVLFNDSKEATKVNLEISKIKDRLGWKKYHEFKFNKAPKNAKILFLETICKFDFEIYAVYIDKANHSDAVFLSDKQKLYNWTIKELLKSMPLKEAFVKIDGRANKKYVLNMTTYLRKEVNIDEYKIKQIKTQDSAKDNLMQLADMIAGTINRSLQNDKTDSKLYIGIIKDKIKSIKSLEIK